MVPIALFAPRPAPVAQAAPAAAPAESLAPAIPQLPPLIACGTPVIRSGTAFTACYQIPDVAPGRYQLQLLDDYLPLISEPPAEGGSTFTAPAGVTMTLSPAAGPPGTLVTARGVDPAAAGEPPGPAEGGASFCWGASCNTSLLLDGTLSWGSGGQFTATFHVPATGWMGPDGVVPLHSGSYPVTIVCLGAAPGSMCLDTPVAQATFRLEVSGPQPCDPGHPCGAVSVSTSTVVPGQAIEISGWQPPGALTPDGPGQLQLVPASAAGTPNPEALIHLLPASVLLAATDLTVKPGTAWAVLAGQRPILEQSNSLSPLASDPADPVDLAWCATGAIEESRNGGTTWRSIPLAGLTRLTGTATCREVAIDGSHPASIWASSVISPANELNGWPPPTPGFFTTDGGATWHPVPVPPGAAAGLSGFRVEGDAVQALYGDPVSSSSAGQAVPFPVEQTTDGGRHWSMQHLACPSVGPCLTWAPNLTGLCAMNASPQDVISSADGGATWSADASPVEHADACSGAFLVSLATGAVLVLPGRLAPFAAVLSTDGGRSWAAVTEPAPAPGAGPGIEPDQGNMAFLPDGAVLVEGGGSGQPQQLLTPGATGWCPVAGLPTPAADPSGNYDYQPIGNRLWWPTSTATATEWHSTADSALACG
jgi:hypothetical protein